MLLSVLFLLTPCFLSLPPSLNWAFLDHSSKNQSKKRHIPYYLYLRFIVFLIYLKVNWWHSPLAVGLSYHCRQSPATVHGPCFAQGHQNETQVHQGLADDPTSACAHWVSFLDTCSHVLFRLGTFIKNIVLPAKT